MINTIETFVREHMFIHLVLISLSVASIVGAMLVDLISGVKKAREANIARTSTGYKKTVAKAQKYFSPLMVLIFIDLISCIVVPFPAFSMTWAAYCVFCEFKSVREKSWQKVELRKAQRTMNIVIENKDDIAKIVADMLFEKEKEEKNEKRV